jgi:hypothetical protein
MKTYQVESLCGGRFCLAKKVPITAPNIAAMTNKTRAVRHIAQYGITPHSFRLIHACHFFGGGFFSVSPSSSNLIRRALSSDVKLRVECRDPGDPGSSSDSNSGFLVANPRPPAPAMAGMAEAEVVRIGATTVAPSRPASGAFPIAATFRA